MGAVVKNTRIKGNALMLTLGGVDYWSDISSYSLAPADSDKDIVTFADAAAGSSSSWTLSGKAIQSMDSGSLWRHVWEHVGETVAFVLAPFGNAIPSATQPHFTGKVTIGSKPALGGDAGNDPFDFEFEWDVIDEPLMVTQKTS